MTLDDFTAAGFSERQLSCGMTVLTRLSCESSLVADATPIVALHGWLDNAASFLPLSEHLNQPMYIFEWRGHGASRWLEGPHSGYWFSQWSKDLYNAFNELQLDSVILLGHSMGAMVACQFAAAFPERVSKLICMDAFAMLFESPTSAVQRLRDSIIQQSQTVRPARQFASFELAVQARVTVSDLDYPQALLLARRGVRQSDNGWYWHQDPSLKWPSLQRVTQDVAAHFITAVNMPALLLLGEQGFAQVKNIAEQFQAQMRHWQQAVLPGGHHFHMSHATATAQRIANFLQTAENSI